MGGSIDEAWDQVLQLKAAVEAVAELGEIALLKPRKPQGGFDHGVSFPVPRTAQK